MTNERTQNEAGYTGYEYREITVPGEHAPLCLDSSPCCGWEPDPNYGPKLGGGRRAPGAGAGGRRTDVTLHFRRVRSICNKAELTRLQRHFDSCVAELQALEQSRTTQAVIAALCTGLLGTAFLAGSTFAATAEPPVIWLMILLAVPGFLGWIVPYFLYRTLVRRKTAAIEPLLEQKYEEINGICEKGSRLLY